ncbi:MAG: hypothetical protein EOO60_01345 [Hymenobacter sp.]|nr:MAG: hypothetical protein EOO60_01345 [Hymenobacter sp.]
MKVFPFYSFSRGIAVEDLWHNNDECEIGLSIPLLDRRAGKDHIDKHCPYCQLLNAPRSVRPVLIP